MNIRELNRLKENIKVLNINDIKITDNKTKYKKYENIYKIVPLKENILTNDNFIITLQNKKEININNINDFLINISKNNTTLFLFIK